MIYSRRSFLRSAAILAAAAASRAEAATTESGGYGDLEAADEWMRRWMKTPHASSGPLKAGRFADRFWYLLDDIGWQPNPGQESHKAVTVPKGFVTDFASIPRAFWSALPTDGPYYYSSVIHDYLYWEQTVTREEADLILLYSMQDFHIGQVTIDAVYYGVKAGGGSAWSENARLKGAGEKRVLKDFPSDPTIQWVDWKKKADVFSP